MNPSHADQRPLVSVVMTVLNPHPVYFRQAVQSILAQTLADFELLILDEPSPRCTRALLADIHDPRIRYHFNPRRSSLVDEKNRGLATARAEFVAMQDADDIAELDRLQKQLDYLLAHPDIAVLGSQIAIMDAEGKPLGFRAYPTDHDAIVRSMRRFNPLAHPSIMCRKNVLVEAGGYRKYFTEDYEFWSRLARQGVRFANHPDPLLRYRIHADGLKSARLRAIIRGTQEVKDLHWRDLMDLRDQAQKWGERLLLLLPPWLVLKLFMKTQYRPTL
ncbi:MAG TPA: glycosyltransferase [Gemmataceae bacterium]|jgi:glycosyltransferase involved in cell wall biosynthesis|nr:glycosyltransferase [Gemmataceae bacterium]